ncbi:MAG: CBS domain-containing protein [archaeon]
MREIRVKDIMKKVVLSVSEDNTIEDLAKVMKKTGIGGVLVLDHGKIKGIITKGDVMRKVLAVGKDYKKTKVKEAMSSPVHTIDINESAENAMKMMRSLNIERLPVLKDDKLVGIITERDIIAIAPSLIELAEEKNILEIIPAGEKEITLAGECEECGNYSESLRYIRGLWLCENCR